MNVKSIHPMKPVLVTDVSDDINVLQKDDVTKQRTVLTARAIEDVFKCAPIVKTNESVAVHPDNAYFNAAGKIDLNTIVTAQSRRLESNTYVNGPENQSLTLKDNVSGNAAYAASHAASVYKPAGFLYVFSILDNSMLSWNNWDGVIPIQDELGSGSNGPEADADIAVRKVDDRALSDHIRQIFVPTDFNEYLTADGTKFPNDARVGSTPRNYRSRYNIGKQLTRVGHKTIVNGQVTYQWEGWYDMSKTHDGPEYFTNIIVGTPNDAFYKKFGFETPRAADRPSTALISSPLTDAVYHIYCQVNEFRLPNANLDAFKVGQKIILEVHPPQSEATSSVRVFYQDTSANGQTSIGTEQQVLITPRVRRNTKDVFGNVSEETLVTSVACFEIVEINEGGQTFRTWELDAGVEETDFTAGMAQMLGEHTDRCSGDIVNYQSEYMANASEFTINFPLTSAGFAIARLIKRDDTRTLSDASWKMWVKIVKANSESCFTRVNTALYPTPDPSKIYYVKEGVTWRLAEGATAGVYDGHPTSFNSSFEYYFIELTNCEEVSLIRVPDASADGGYRTYVTLADLDWDKMRGFSSYGNRGDILSITISSTNNAYYFRDKLFPVVMFCPDPHDSYIHKASINPSAFTYNQLKELFLDGTTIDDIRLANASELLEGIMNAPVSTRALIEAYSYLAQKLQLKGLLFGNNIQRNVTIAEIDRLVDGGFYYVIPKTLNVEPGHFPPKMTLDGCNFVVISNKRAPGGMVHEEEGGVVDQDKAVQLSVITGDPTNPAGDMFEFFYRLGVKNASTGVWVWSAWRSMNDYRSLDNKPRYFRARWDYLEDPNGFINLVNGGVETRRIDSGYVAYTQRVTATTMRAFLDTVNSVDENTLEETVSGTTTVNAARELDLQYSTFNSRSGNGDPVNYRVPQLFVGLDDDHLTPDTLIADAESILENNPDTKFYYVVDISLPRAELVSSLESNVKQRRRKVRILFSGSPAMTWYKVLCRVHYTEPGSENENAGWNTDESVYQYEREWNAEFTEGNSFIELEFEQVDCLCGGELKRIWCPIEIG